MFLDGNNVKMKKRKEMWKKCPKINKGCDFCGKSKWNPRIGKYDDDEKLFCGLVTGYDARVESLPDCWKEMTKSKKTKYQKIKKEEYSILKVDKIL